jgi:hypothetical protein
MTVMVNKEFKSRSPSAEVSSTRLRSQGSCVDEARQVRQPARLQFAMPTEYKSLRCQGGGDERSEKNLADNF